jgi:hypothetical protein
MADLAVTPTTIIPKKVDAIQLPLVGAILTLYAVPADTATKIAGLVLVNDTTTPVFATLHICPNGGAEGPTNYLCRAVQVPSDGMPLPIPLTEGNGEQLMNATDTIKGFADVADQVTVHLSIVEYSA